MLMSEKHKSKKWKPLCPTYLERRRAKVKRPLVASAPDRTLHPEILKERNRNLKK